jgi:hypothetical protein
MDLEPINKFIETSIDSDSNRLKVILVHNNPNQFNKNNNILNININSEIINKIQNYLLSNKHKVYNNVEYINNNLVYNPKTNITYKNIFKYNELFRLNDNLNLYCEFYDSIDINSLYFPSKQEYHIEKRETVVEFSYTNSINIYIIDNIKLKIIINIDEYIDVSIKKIIEFIKYISTL